MNGEWVCEISPCVEMEGVLKNCFVVPPHDDGNDGKGVHVAGIVEQIENKK